MEERASRLRMGAVCTWIAGGCYFLVVIFAFLSPASVASYVTSNQYFTDFQSYKYDFVVLKGLMAVANAALVGVIVALYSLRRARGQGWMDLLTILAVVGLGVGMYQSIVDATVVPHLAKEYEHASSIVQHVIIAFGVANPALYILSLGLPGLWFIFMSLSFKEVFSPVLVIFNFLWGLGNITTVFAHLFVLIWLIYLISAGALVTAPFWTIWLSRFLSRASK